ncbi:MAG: cupin domain-containing protein [Thermoleophilia bacterium]|nr:cupin domain-containing protein [Thermoleophilia bacterium]
MPFVGLERYSAGEVIELLRLEPHPEGGYYRETYCSPHIVPSPQGDRPLCTSILYLLTDKSPSRFHRLRSDEVWFFHAGAALALFVLGTGSRAGEAPRVHTESQGCADESSATPSPVRCSAAPSPVILDSFCPQVLVPAGQWMGAQVIAGKYAAWGTDRVPERRWVPDRRGSQQLDWTLVGCVVSPGFHFEDFELAEREALLREFPLAKEVILALT